ncbi:DnaJ domain-containing protein [Arvimicrobium flavum]|uniref:DnaJ domain-containing protein n=1 Tax=Arvimicrobium flavum TaxID=3393320 RepID=UPI00237B84FB|nr:DnaJ domain-containing protein [Mesorhizobium shangrilense]
MSVFLGLLAGLTVIAALFVVFVRTDAQSLANGLRLAGPVVAGVAGVVLMLLGRAGLGGMLISGALAWFASVRRATRATKSPSRRSTVRTAALEMELDHDTGALEGIVLAGRYEGSILTRMSEADLLGIYAELASDGESRQLLETYLDGRFPAWREDLKADAGHGKGIPPGSGAMTKEEAYKVLGLESGATPADVRKAHRRLMQRLHPDIGGSPFLAARINEAKDVLLSDHN